MDTGAKEALHIFYQLSLILKEALKTFWPHLVAHSFFCFSLLARVATWKRYSVFMGLAGWMKHWQFFHCWWRGWWTWLWVPGSLGVLEETEANWERLEIHHFLLISFISTYRILSNSWSSNKMPQTCQASRPWHHHAYLCQILLLWVTKVDMGEQRPNLEES